ncbi:MAG: hypothetical protein RBT63_09520 [Bdellovibrionales bacterium]|jgi:hypothetical protein|nr:hypothetical protein [Bdellovibrionales bacterium]
MDVQNPTATLADLLARSVSERDENWEAQFLKVLPTASVRLVKDQPINGPDGWPYMMVSIVDGAAEAEALIDVLRWLSTRGVGLVVNPEKPMPDFVVSYGMIANLRERGEFLTASAPRKGALEIRHGQQMFTGAPSLAFFPEYQRVVVREFLRQQRVEAPKVLMVSEDQQNWDLAFSLESLGNPPPHEHKGIAEALGWFLPAHYSVALISEKTLPGFGPL